MGNLAIHRLQISVNKILVNPTNLHAELVEYYVSSE